MKIKGMILFLITILSLLVACGEGETDKEAVNEEVASEAEENPELTVDEAREIVTAHFRGLDEAMENIQKLHREKPTDFSWTREYDESHPEYIEILEDTKPAFSKLVSENFVDEIAARYIMSYFCSCDMLFTFNENELVTRFHLVEQEENQFTVSYLNVETMFGHLPGTNYLTYVKEGENWLLQEHRTVSPEEESLNLTAEDLAIHPESGEAGEFIQFVNEGGENYIVMKYGDVYEVRNTVNSTHNWDLENKFSISPPEPVNNEQAKFKPVPVNYKTETLSDSGSGWEVEVSYPVFSNKVLDKVITDTMEETFEEHVQYYKAQDKSNTPDGLVMTFALDFDDVLATDRFISIRFNAFMYQGGAHGSTWSRPLNYDLIENRVVELEDILNGDVAKVDSLVHLLHEKLIVRNDIFGPTEVSDYLIEKRDVYLNDFALKEDKVVFYFQPYAVGPYASGVIEVDVSYDELNDL